MRSDFGEAFELGVFDRIAATIVRQLTFRENEIGALNRVAIRKTVTGKNCRYVGRIHQTHHRRFTGGASMTARLFEEGKLRPP